MRVGLSGCGRRGAAVVAAVRTHEGCDVVALHDPDPAACARLGDAAGIPLRFGDFDALLGTGVDFVVLTGPCGDRLAQVEAAAAQSAHCLVHAPMAPDAASAAAMVASCDAAGVQLGVAVSLLADPLSEQLRRMIAGGWLGAAVLAGAMAADDRCLREPPPPGHWRRDARRAGKGALVQLGSELVHAIAWLLGRSPTRAVSLATSGLSALPQDSACAAVELKGGVLCTLATSHLTRASSLWIHGTDGELRLSPDRLFLRGHEAFCGEVFDYERAGEERTLLGDELQRAGAALLPRFELCGRFARFLDDRDDFPILGEQAAADLRALDAPA